MIRLDYALKVVYAWMGPKGPIWNTELPTIMSFVNAGEEMQPHSRMWWQDDLWRRIFRYKKENWILWANSEVTDRDIFLYPYSLTWRIPFNNYFFGNTGILEYSHISGHVLHQIRSGQGFILIDLSVEAFVEEDNLMALHNYFNVVKGLPLNKIIYLTGCMNANEIYEDFCRRRNIPKRADQRLNIISNPSSQAIYATQLSNGALTEPNYDENKVPEKVFLCWNRRYRSHRIELSIALNKHGLVDRSYYSLGLSDPEQPASTFRNYADIYNNPYLELQGPDVENLFNKLPLKIDNHTQIEYMCEDRDMEARNFYTNSLVSLVTETNYNLGTVTLTEKSFKPVKEKHPFIIVGAQGSLKAMRDLGYKTFGEFWSESYDDLHDPKARMVAIVNICREIGSWESDKILDFKRKVKHILDHNFNLLRTSPEELISEKIANTMINQLAKIGKIDLLKAEQMKMLFKMDSHKK